MAQFWKTKNFRQLAKEWNLKLEEQGFIDAEIDLKGDRALKQRATNSYRQATQLERESRLEYYVLMGNLAINEIFPNELESVVMIRHSEGATIKEIVKEISFRGIFKNRKTIRHIIRRWQSRWGIKTWNLRQMNLRKIIG